MGFWKTWKEVMLSSKAKHSLIVLAILLAVLVGIPISIISFAMASGYGADTYAIFMMVLLLIGIYLLVLLLLWSIVLLILYLKTKKRGKLK